MLTLSLWLIFVSCWHVPCWHVQQVYVPMISSVSSNVKFTLESKGTHVNTTIVIVRAHSSWHSINYNVFTALIITALITEHTKK